MIPSGSLHIFRYLVLILAFVHPTHISSMSRVSVGIQVMIEGRANIESDPPQ